MFRKIKEIREEKVNSRENNYKEIKPRTKITTKECNEFWEREMVNIAIKTMLEVQL